jgi:hypothetical protein
LAGAVSAFKPERILWKRRLAWAGTAAFLGCVACCAVPLLAVVGGTGLLASIAEYVRPGSVLVVGGVAFVGALGWGAVSSWRQRKRAASCGCGPKEGSVASLFRSATASGSEPIVCTADLRDKPAVQEQMDRYRAAFVDLAGTDRFAGGFRWRFRSRPGLEAELKLLAEREADCCRFFQFDLLKQGDELHWETRTDERAASVLDEFSRLPERLSQEPRCGHDVAVLKRSAGAAGLVFAADERGD